MHLAPRVRFNTPETSDSLSAWHCSRLSSRQACTSPSWLCAARCSGPARTPCASSTWPRPTPSAAWASTSDARCPARPAGVPHCSRPCATPHPDSRPHQLGELNVLEEEEIDALLAGAHAALWTAAAQRPRPSLGPPALRRPANAIPSSGRPASTSLGQLTGTCWLARVSLSLMGPESRR